jgi:hypothetical protein
MHWISQICKVPNLFMCTLNLIWLLMHVLKLYFWWLLIAFWWKLIALIFMYYVLIDVLVALIFLRWPPLTSLFFSGGPPAKTTSPLLLIKNERSLNKHGFHWNKFERTSHLDAFSTLFSLVWYGLEYLASVCYPLHFLIITL